MGLFELIAALCKDESGKYGTGRTQVIGCFALCAPKHLVTSLINFPGKNIVSNTSIRLSGDSLDCLCNKEVTNFGGYHRNALTRNYVPG